VDSGKCTQSIFAASYVCRLLTNNLAQLSVIWNLLTDIVRVHRCSDFGNNDRWIVAAPKL